MKREFASLSVQEALHVAIFIEERNANLYHQFAELFAEFRDPASLEIAGTFEEMAGEERRHSTLLQERYFERFGTQSCAVTEEDIRDFIEVPDLDRADLFTTSKLKTGHTPRERALEVAVATEQSALQYYTRLAGMTPDAGLRDFYRELVDMESGHTDWLHKKMAETRRASGGTRMA